MALHCSYCSCVSNHMIHCIYSKWLNMTNHFNWNSEKITSSIWVWIWDLRFMYVLCMCVSFHNWVVFGVHFMSIILKRVHHFAIDPWWRCISNEIQFVCCVFRCCCKRHVSTVIQYGNLANILMLREPSDGEPFCVLILSLDFIEIVCSIELAFTKSC